MTQRFTSTVPLLHGQPAHGGEPVFAEPWQAQAFAMAVALHAKGLFTWVEWAQALAAQISAAATRGEADEDGSRYYHHWLDALEALVTAKGAAGTDELHKLEHAWERAALRTPHGQPIALQPGDFNG